MPRIRIPAIRRIGIEPLPNHALSTALTFPHPTPPAPGSAIEVAPGILWVRLALPFRLDHVNVYLIEDGAGWAVLDTGLDDAVTRAAWDALLDGALRGRALTRILVTHFHPDHIDGIKTKDGDKVFRNAEILVPEPEWTFWMDDGNQSRASGSVLGYFRNARRIFGDIANEVHRFTPGAEVVPGIVSLPAYGHTPGHTAFSIQSGKQSLLVMSDTVRNPELFARHPDWQPIFDMDGALAVKTRRRMLDRAAADRMLVEAYHFPFPACGHMIRRGAGYELVPSMWRPL